MTIRFSIAFLTFLLVSGCASDTVSSLRVEPFDLPFKSVDLSANGEAIVEKFSLSPGEDTDLIEGKSEEFKVLLSIVGLTDGITGWEVTTYFNGHSRGPFILDTLEKNGRFSVSVGLAWDIVSRRKEQVVLVELTSVLHSKSGKTIQRQFVASINRDYVVCCNPENWTIIRKIKALLGRCYQPH
jgi:hypothetical protein